MEKKSFQSNGFFLASLGQFDQANTKIIDSESVMKIDMQITSHLCGLICVFRPFPLLLIAFVPILHEAFN